MKYLHFHIFWVGSVLLFTSFACAQETFNPPSSPPEIRVTRTTEKIMIDGLIDEAAWTSAKAISEFVQYEPRQGEKPTFQTEFRILFDNKNIYFSAVCYDSLGRKGVRVPNMQRDFSFDENDLVGIALDGLLDRRNAMAFQTNPYGAQRELLISDGTNFNREWISLWSVNTRIHTWGWTAEFAIPWKSIRYNPNSDKMGVILLRSLRRLNENITYPAIPRVFTPYQMPYEAVLVGLEPPSNNGLNFQLNPYVLVDTQQTTRDGEGTNDTDIKMGGEVKYALSTNSVLDVTYNTDFAQVDVDRQVVNLARFSVLFPERRQFFLEGNEIYTMQALDAFQPFFSRQIGLDNGGSPIPIEAGARFTNRSANGNIGALAIRQRGRGFTPAANFAVARYSRNISEQGTRLGALATFRYDEADTSGNTNTNTTVTVDGLWRPNQKFNTFWMLSGSQNNGVMTTKGWGGSVWSYYETNDIYIGHVQAVISDDYEARAGFVDATNYILTSPAITAKLRPAWLPTKWLRQYSPGITFYFYHYYNDLTFREGFISYRPILLNFQNGGSFSYSLVTNWQNPIETFSPVNIDIAAGRYRYTSHNFSFETDNSRKLYFKADYSSGGYFNGKIQSWDVLTRVAPDPHVALTLRYLRNQLNDLGINRLSRTTELATAEIRLALNPRLQWISFYQYNTADDRSTLNTRVQWEYKPLSFLFLVLNDNRQDVLQPDTQVNRRVTEQQGVFKLAYLKQF